MYKGIINEIPGIVISDPVLKNGLKFRYKRVKIPKSKYDIIVNINNEKSTFVLVIQPKDKRYINYNINNNSVSQLNTSALKCMNTMIMCNKTDLFVGNKENFKKKLQCINTGTNGIIGRVCEYEFVQPLKILKTNGEEIFEKRGWYGLIYTGKYDGNVLDEDNIIDYLSDSFNVNLICA